MTNEEFLILGDRVKKMLQAASPIRTGNLRYNAIKLEQKDANTIVIHVDQDIAPYMPYTNEPWLSPRWNGKKNPNEAWFDNAVEKIAYMLAQSYRGKIKLGDR